MSNSSKPDLHLSVFELTGRRTPKQGARPVNANRAGGLVFFCTAYIQRRLETAIGVFSRRAINCTGSGCRGGVFPDAASPSVVILLAIAFARRHTALR